MDHRRLTRIVIMKTQLSSNRCASKTINRPHRERSFRVSNRYILIVQHSKEIYRRELNAITAIMQSEKGLQDTLKLTNSLKNSIKS